MKYIPHLEKLNRLHGGGRVDLWQLVVAYNLRRIFQRPTLVKMSSSRSRYRHRKKLLYTIMTGGYDQLNELPVKLPNWDYLCFTDNDNLVSSTWRICLLNNEMGLDPIRLSRHFKINSHMIENDYDLTMYIDANLRIRGDLDSFLVQALPFEKDFAILQHPFLFSLRQELEKCVEEGKDDENMLRRQFQHYTDEKGFQDNLPHINARLMIRRSGKPELKGLMEIWFAQLMRWSRRDQMAFNYALSLCPEVQPHYIPYWIFRNYFQRLDHR